MLLDLRRTGNIAIELHAGSAQFSLTLASSCIKSGTLQLVQWTLICIDIAVGSLRFNNLLEGLLTLQFG